MLMHHAVLLRGDQAYVWIWFFEIKLKFFYDGQVQVRAQPGF